MMKKLVSALALCGLTTVSLSALAEDSPHSVSANVGVTTDYIFRGVTQTQHDPAIQGGVDYSHASGLYAGAWASNIKWVEDGGYKDDSNFEIDVYGGYRGTAGDLGYDVGAIVYYYPGDKITGVKSPDTAEIYVSGSWKFLTLKYSHVVSSNFIGWYDYGNSKSSRNSRYLELNANYDLGDGWGVQGHVGHQVVQNLSDANYTDWKVGVSKDVGFGVVSLAYSDTNADDDLYVIDGKKIANGRFVLAFLKTF
jgi:uncharacterized protein (TIGR02001 family)